MMYQPLFHIALRHDYYPDLRCPDFSLAPDIQGEKLIREHRLIVRSYLSAWSVLIPTENNNPVVDISSDAIFSFQLLLRNTRFYHFTDIPTAERPLVYENVQKSNTLKIINASATHQLPEGTFGLIRIRNVSFKKEAPIFTLQFDSKKVCWKYVLVTDVDSPASFRIEQLQHVHEGKQLEFKTPSLPEGKLNTALTELLSQDYPYAKTLIVESKEAIPFFQKGRKNIQLKKDNMVLVDHLPNPSPEEGGIKVIKYLKNQKS